MKKTHALGLAIQGLRMALFSNVLPAITGKAAEQCTFSENFWEEIRDAWTRGWALYIVIDPESGHVSTLPHDTLWEDSEYSGEDSWAAFNSTPRDEFGRLRSCYSVFLTDPTGHIREGWGGHSWQIELHIYRFAFGRWPWRWWYRFFPVGRR